MNECAIFAGKHGLSPIIAVMYRVLLILREGFAMRLFNVLVGIMMVAVSFASIADDYEDAKNYEKDNRPARSILTYFKAAEADNVNALVYLGHFFRKANGRDNEAFRLFARAAYLGNADAKFFLGLFCGLQKGPCEDYKKETILPWAYSWYLLAGEETLKSWNTGTKKRDELGNKMLASERAEGERLALSFQEFMQARQPTPIVSSAEKWGVAECPETWPTRGQTGNVQWGNLCSEFRPVSSSEFRDIKEIMEYKIREEDLAFENKNRQDSHIKELQNGVVQPADIREAWQAQEVIADLTETMFSPLLKPDNKIYGARLVLDSEDKSGNLRVRWDMDSFDSFWSSPLEEKNQKSLERGVMRLSELRVKYGGTVVYAQLNRTAKATTFASNLRLGNYIWVIGRYVANKKYTKVNKTEGTMPVFEVLFIGESSSTVVKF